VKATTVAKPFESYESGAYLLNNPSWDEEDSEWKASQVLKIILSNRLEPKSIVEVGCGAGGVLASLHDALPDISYSGYDIAPDAAQFWEKHAARKISFSISDFLNEKTGHFDVLMFTSAVQLLHVLELADLAGLRDEWMKSANGCLVASIGPTTSESLRAVGLDIDFEPSHPKMGTLVRETMAFAAVNTKN